MKRVILVLVLLGVIILLVGCWNNNLDDRGKGNLKVVINWDDFSRLQTQISLNQILSQKIDYDQITHTGARVIYPKYNASFSQSVKKEIAEEQGIITFSIPSTENAKLYVVAVRFSGQEENMENNKALWFGVVENIAIPVDGIVEITMNDINWTTASWRPGEGYENYALGFKAPREEEVHKIPIYVRDPFQVGENPSWNQLYVKIWGRSNYGNNSNGWRLFQIYNGNEHIGETNTKKYHFQPYIEPSLFNLTNASGYSIPPIADRFEVSWE
ncbi:MAG: hypothetical protein MI740_11270 [Halanaerobiales bacterium]|nr:hypothetical protein [Halanaerobiales bacterium]